MRIAFTTAGNDLESPIEMRFGRSPQFLIYTVETDSVALVSNEQNLNAAQGAGIQAASTLVREKVDCLVTGHCGPKAFRVLTASGVKIFTINGGTIRENLEKFKTAQLKQLQTSDVDSHW